MEDREGKMASTKPTKGIEVFFSYAHEDEKWRKELEKHLSLMRWQGLISGWNDREIGAGEEWNREIETHLKAAHIILLLISPNFMASKFCYGIEMKRAMKRHNADEARVIPIILHEVDWKKAPFGKLQALPTDGKAITSWSNRNQSLLNVVVGIHKVVEELTKKR